MPFLGNQPSTGYSTIVKDDFTANGNDTVFTLSRTAASANSIAVFVGNVRQEPTDAYTVNGTTLTMSAAPANGANFYVLHISGAVENSSVPASDTVGTGQLINNAVTTAKIADDQVTTAKIADDQVTTAKIADDQITSAKLANAINIVSGNSLTIDSGATITNNGTASGFGKVLQVVTNVVTDVVVSRTSTTWGEITSDTRVTITPISSSSNLILMHTVTYNQSASLYFIDHFKFYDITNGADVCVGSNASRAAKVTTALRGPAYDINDASVLPMTGVTASATTTARTYGVYHKCEQSASRSFYASNGTGGTYPWTAPSVFVVMEVE